MTGPKRTEYDLRRNAPPEITEICLTPPSNIPSNAVCNLIGIVDPTYEASLIPLNIFSESDVLGDSGIVSGFNPISSTGAFPIESARRTPVWLLRMDINRLWNGRVVCLPLPELDISDKMIVLGRNVLYQLRITINPDRLKTICSFPA